MSALTEIVEAAEQHGWIVSSHPVTRFSTTSVRDGQTTLHDDIVVVISPSDEMVEADRGRSYGQAVKIVALFRQSGAFHTAFKAGVSYDEIEAYATQVAEERVSWLRKHAAQHSDQYLADLIEKYKAEARYRAISQSKSVLSKAGLLDALVNHPIVLAERRKATEAKYAAEQRAREIARLEEQVIPNNEVIVAQATEDAQEALEAIKDAVRATHPTLFIEAPGLLDSVVLAVLGTVNEGTSAVAFIHARARSGHGRG